MKPWELHPALVHFPIAFLLGAIVLDLYAWVRARNELKRVVYGLLIAGVVSGVVAALAGILAYFTIPNHTQSAHDMMSRHIWLQATAVALFTVNAIIRWRNSSDEVPTAARLIGVIAASVLIWGSSIGGEMVYRAGTGIDPKALAPFDKQHSHDGEEHNRHGPKQDSKPPTNADDNGVRQL
ncbi:DUF2231 domain-containing protein [Oscillatoria laete-virens NRMC-F 0139]|nr:DUF2231 domain-containing protein [Oscillatoria laete-virens]MDL5054129.1 DUF2231 domain-containing protein [Oscillatoria laete-virens NRMC-F 0139]